MTGSKKGVTDSSFKPRKRPASYRVEGSMMVEKNVQTPRLSKKVIDDNKTTGLNKSPLTGRIVNKNKLFGSIVSPKREMSKNHQIEINNNVIDEVDEESSIQESNMNTDNFDNYSNDEVQADDKKFLSEPNSTPAPPSSITKEVVGQKAVGVGKQVVSGSAKVLAKFAAFIAANPWIIPAIGIVIIIFLIVIIVGGGASSFETGKSGLYGYDYLALDNVCDTVKVYNPKTGSYTRELDFETEYIPGVVSAEVGGFTDAPELLKLFSIAARSYALSRLDSSCTIEGSARVQAFRFDENELNDVTSEDHPIRQAADATFGLVATRNESLLSVNYDAACYRGEDNLDYFIGYGSITLGEEQIQRIPKSWAQNQKIMGYINKSKSENKLCAGNHGYGISQWGAYYLATEQDYSLEQLIEYYIGSDIKLYSIYPSASDNYTLATSSGNTDILTTPLKDFLASKGTSVEAYNEYILKNVLNAGVGTRNAAVITATSLVGTLYQNFGARLPYTYGGQHGQGNMYALNTTTNLDRIASSFYGVDPNWGSPINPYYLGGYGPYNYYGPDCSGFVSWVITNAGFKPTASTSQSTFGPKHQLNGTLVAQPGDLLWHPGHIMFIVGVDEEKQVYYIAHASCGSEGVKINAISFNSPENYAIDMTDWYANNRLDVTQEEWIERYRSGYVEGYSGSSEPLNIDTNKEIYFVGDSRTVGLCYTNSLCKSLQSCDTNSCLAKVGEGYKWFENNQIPSIKKTNKGIIVINMGANDLTGSADGEKQAEKYFNKYLSLANTLKTKEIYIMSVNPVDEGTTIKKSTILAFNNKMRDLINNSNLLNLKYIDAYNNVSFITTDGLHYNSDTYKKLYKYVKGVVQ